MHKRPILGIALIITALGLAGFGAWLATLPTTPAIGPLPPIAKEETNATLIALKPPKRQRPLVAIIGANEGTETTDYLMPYGILKRADVVDVVALGTKPGPIRLYPVFNVEPDMTVTDFDARHSEGADYVIVPAMERADDPTVLQWIRNQSEKGALIIGVCVGATVVANAGLLDGKRATTHWYSLKGMFKEHPEIRYVPNRRFVVDGRVATTTGITASMPITLTLIEAIAGRAKAKQVAVGLGVDDWDARHASDAFKLTRGFALTAMANKLAFWNREQFGIELNTGIDEVSMALVGDAWSRTYRSRATTFASHPHAITTRSSLRITPDQIATTWPAERLIRLDGNHPPAQALNETLRGLESRYGARTARLVAMQLEYPRPPERTKSSD